MDLTMNILAGDIGGTKTNLAIFSLESGLGKPLSELSYPSGKYDSLEAIIREFHSHANLPFSRACFGVAGPVIEGRAQITNLPWVVDAGAIQSAFNLTTVALLNDLESVAYAIPILKAEDIFTLNEGKSIQGAPIAVIAPGTGLGEGFLTYACGHYIAHASEGSHTSFAPENELQMGLWKFLKDKGYEHISFERVCSGALGVPLLYEYLKSIGAASEPDWLAAQLAECPDPTPVIFNAAHDPQEPAPLAAATVKLFVEILGAEAGNLALKVLSTGGLYLGGGIPPRIIKELQHPDFLEFVRAKGRFRSVLSEIPIHVIMNPRAALLGAAAYGLSMND
jgi:glucokinase